jgi:hypothetical protein
MHATFCKIRINIFNQQNLLLSWTVVVSLSQAAGPATSSHGGAGGQRERRRLAMSSRGKADESNEATQTGGGRSQWHRCPTVAAQARGGGSPQRRRPRSATQAGGDSGNQADTVVRVEGDGVRIATPADGVNFIPYMKLLEME